MPPVACEGQTKDVDGVAATLVDERGDLAAVYVVQPAARKFRQIGNGRRKIEFALEPRLYGMAVRGDDVEKMVGLKRSDVTGDQFRDDGLRRSGPEPDGSDQACHRQGTEGGPPPGEPRGSRFGGAGGLSD